MGWQRTDDLDGTPAEQVTFGLDGKAYVVDLGDVEHAKLANTLQRFLTVATVYGALPDPPEFPGYLPVAEAAPQSTEAVRPDTTLGQAPSVRGGRTASVTKERVEVPQKVIRAWAIGRGYQVGPKGRIPEAIVTTYYEAQAH